MACLVGAQIAQTADCRESVLDHIEAVRQQTSDADDVAKAMAFASEFQRAAAEAGYWPFSAAELTDAELISLFSATELTAFYTADPQHAAVLMAVFAELEKRGIATHTQTKNAYETLVQSQLFSQALLLRANHPWLEELPRLQLTAAKGPSYWHDLGPGGLRLDGLDISSGSKIVVVAHPDCHFSQNAFLAIERDDALESVFQSHAMLLAPPPRVFELAKIRQWNTTHPSLPMSLAFSKAQWPITMSWETPTFYFYRNGKLMAKVQGWPADGRKQELLAAARAIGLTD